MKSMPAQIIPAWQLPKNAASRGITHRPLCKYIHDDVIKMETFSALLYLCAEISPVPGEFSSQRSVTRSFDVFFDLSLNKTLVKQSRRWWFETPSRSLWHHCNEHITSCCFVLTSPYAPNTFTYKYWYVISYMLLKRLLHNEIIQVVEMFLHHLPILHYRHGSLLVTFWPMKHESSRGPAWKSNHMPCKVWDEITQTTFPNFNGSMG